MAKAKRRRSAWRTPKGYVGMFVRVRESTRELLRATLQGMRASQDPGEAALDGHSLGALVEQCVVQVLGGIANVRVPRERLAGWTVDARGARGRK